MFRSLCPAALGVPVRAAFPPFAEAPGGLPDMAVVVPAIPGDRVEDGDGLCALAAEIAARFATPIDRILPAIRVLAQRPMPGQGRVTVEGAVR